MKSIWLLVLFGHWNKERLVASAIWSLDKRFDEMLNDDTVLAARIFDPLNGPVETEQIGYGNNHVATLANRFKNHVQGLKNGFESGYQFGHLEKRCSPNFH